MFWSKGVYLGFIARLLDKGQWAEMSQLGYKTYSHQVD